MIVGTLLIIFLLILANGFFVAAEISIIAARKGRLEQMAEGGDRSAGLRSNWPTIQIAFCRPCNSASRSSRPSFPYSAANSSSIRWRKCSRRFHSMFVAEHAHGISLAIVVASLTFLSLLLGELVPKQIALRQAELLARFVAPILTWINTIARPFVWLMRIATDMVLFLFRIKKSTEPSVSLIDIEHLIEAGTQEGVFESVEQRVAMETLRLGDRTVRDVMRPAHRFGRTRCEHSGG